MSAYGLRGLSLWLLVALAFTPMAEAAGCAQAVAQKGEEVYAARQALIALPIGDGHETKVSPAAQQAILKMKSRVADLVDAYMGCAGKDIVADEITSELSRIGHAFELEKRQYKDEELPPDAGHYGFELSFEGKRWTDPEDTITIKVEFSIECGGDSVLFAFQHRLAGWHEVLRWQSKPYSSIGKAFEALDYALSPADAAGRWYVVVKRIAPWCSSTWSDISYAVLRPSYSSDVPKILYRGTDQIWWGNDDLGQLTARRNDFEIRFHSHSIDTGVHNRVWIRHFSIDGNSVRRIPPFALSQRDFVDEWIVSSWKEARAWSALSARGTLARMHGIVRLVYEKTDLEYDSGYVCAGAAERYQIGLLANAETPLQKTYYFIVEGDPDYRMVSVSQKPDPSCGGENILWQKWPLEEPSGN
jgi:hypothetical protein